ncbi:RNA-binding protein 25-like, partial [Trifolium medium]|nr:RNA-binding protein 25-like [Trifolium medium]
RRECLLYHMEDVSGWNTVKGRIRNRKVQNQQWPDIATAPNFSLDNATELTSYYFTDIPDNYGAKAMFNAFNHYGNIKEVVIPVKRDIRGRRFGFARFTSVTNPLLFERELDTIIIGRDKIAVNISRYQRQGGFGGRSDEVRVEVGKDGRRGGIGD